MNSKYLSEGIVKDILDVDVNDSNEISDERSVRAAAAPYQAEFPYERDQESQVTRREFCNFLFLTSTALFLGSAGFAGKLAYNASSEQMFSQLKIEGAEALAPGNALNFRYPEEKDTAILIRAVDGQYYAFEQQCTHLTCPVYYSKERDRLECPCHNGGFDVHTGNVLYGPPPRPLDQILIETRDDGEVWAIGKKTGGGHESA
ncbi:MAG: Rieske (2Fe-2S) protein, partial [Candidatus Binatia bacterium]